MVRSAVSMVRMAARYQNGGGKNVQRNSLWGQLLSGKVVRLLSFGGVSKCYKYDSRLDISASFKYVSLLNNYQIYIFKSRKVFLHFRFGISADSVLFVSYIPTYRCMRSAKTKSRSTLVNTEKTRKAPKSSEKTKKA